MTIERAYELADAITERFNVYTAIRIERFNFNHPDKEAPRITYHFSGQGFDPVAFGSLEKMVEYLEALDYA